MNRTMISIGAVAAAPVFFFAVNILVTKGIGPVRLDLTQDGLYTLTDGTRQILSRLDEPIRAQLYYTEDVAKDFPPQAVRFDVPAFATRVRETLDEFASLSKGKLEVEVIAPQPFSEEEDEASGAGLEAIPGPKGDPLYLGLVLSNSVGDREVMPFLDGAQASFFEYELAKRIHTLSRGEAPTIGLISTLPMDGGDYDPMMRQPPAPAWVVLQQLRSLFTVQSLGTEFTEIPSEVKALLIVHPKELSESTQYAIDQFVLRGHPAIVFVDPQCTLDVPPADPSNPMSQYMQTPGSSDLPDLFRAWGVRLSPGVLAADKKHSLQRWSYERNTRVPKDYVVWILLNDEECIAKEEAAVGSLSGLMYVQGGELEAVAGATTTFTPLLRTSDEGSAITVSKVTAFAQPDELLDGYIARGRPLTLAARVSGPATTAFPDGRPAGAETEAGAPHLAESEKDIRVVVVGDVDMLADDWCYQPRQVMGMNFGYSKVSENGDLLLNLVEQLAGSEDLIKIRGRGDARRPFERVEEIRRKADERLREKEDELQERLDETNARLTELQGEGDGRGGVFITPAQEAEVERFRATQLETRKELRALLHDKDVDIERLGAWIKILNVLLMPVLVIVVGIVYSVLRVSRRSHA